MEKWTVVQLPLNDVVFEHDRNRGDKFAAEIHRFEYPRQLVK